MAIDWEKVARAEGFPLRIEVLEVIDGLGDGARISPVELAPQLGVKPRQIEKQLEALRKKDLIAPYEPWTDEERFRKYLVKGVGPNEDCWGWSGYIKDNGYATFHYNGALTGHGHRYSYQLHHGPIPEGMWVDHLCRNRGCVNPDHLELVTPRENLHRGEVTEVMWRKEAPSKCRNGHPLTEENTLYVKRNERPGRACLTCRAERNEINAARMRDRRAVRRSAEDEKAAA